MGAGRRAELEAEDGEELVDALESKGSRRRSGSAMVRSGRSHLSAMAMESIWG